MNRLEKKYNFIQNIIAWSNGKYKQEHLQKMNMTALFELHNNLYLKRISELETIRK